MADIIRKVGEIHIAVVKDKETRGGELAQKLGELAVAAIMGGLGSEPWRKYMSIFADNPEQLKFLSEEGDPEPDYFSKVRAYIVSNAVCAAGTNTATTNGLTTEMKTTVINAVNNAEAAGVTKPSEISDLLEGL